MRVFILFAFTLLFAGSLEDKLDLLLQKLDRLEKKLEEKDVEIKRLKEEIKKDKKQATIKEALKSCAKIDVSLKAKYYDEIIPYYILHITFKNNYPKDIKELKGSLFAEDKDGVKILQDYINREVNLPAGGEVQFSKKHLLNNELEEYLKDEGEVARVYFKPTRIVFSDGEILECQ